MNIAPCFVSMIVTLETESLAKQVAQQLIKRKLAACVQLKAIESFYEWDNELCVSHEIELSIKTAMHHFHAISEYINEQSTYDTTQILVLPIIDGDQKYMQWLNDSLNGT